MKKIAFIVEPNYNLNHFGVRNYFVTIKNIINDIFITEFVSYTLNCGQYMWYKLIVQNEKEDVCDDVPIIYDRQKNNKVKYKDYISYNKKSDNRKSNYYFQSIGKDLKNENYDMAIITNPWLVSYGLKVDAKIILGITYDFVANEYVFMKKNKPFDWANSHRIGYEFYNEYCNRIFCISPLISQQYKAFFPNVDAERVNHFEPFVTDQFRNVLYEEGNKENSVILAAPFDLRKGLKEIPSILNGLKERIECLYIFGQPRCDVNDFNEFFDKLDLNKIVYYPYITYAGVINLYKRSKILLFPSSEEGLGIPIMEAQICGCRVIAQNKEPMNQLVLDGGYLLTGELDEDIRKIDIILKDNQFNSFKLSQKASEIYSGESIKKVIEKCFVEKYEK